MRAYNATKWTPEMIEYMKANYLEMTNQKLADSLGLTLTVTRNKLNYLGLRKMTLQRWTKEQSDFLVANYQTIGNTELARIFTKKWEKEKGWSKEHICKRLFQMKLKRTEAELIALKEKQIKDGVYAMCAVNMWKTRGKMPCGTITKWGKDKVIKTEKGWRYLRIVNFEKRFGPIPYGMLVTHKDKDNYNCEPENLELINRPENARRNSWRNLPPEYRKAMWTLKRLKNIINKKSKLCQETN